MENTKQKISLPIFKELIKNSFRLTKIIWKEKKGQVTLLALVFLVVSATPFLQSGSRGLLINELVNIAGSGTVTAYLFWLIAILIFASLIPSILFTIQNYLSKLFWFYLEAKFEVEVIKKRGEIDVAIHENPEHNDLFNRVSENGTWRIRSFLDRQFFILQNSVEVIIASAIIIFSQWWVFLIILMGTLPELIAEVRYGRQVWGIHSGRAEVRRKYWDLHRHFQWLPSIVELKLFQNIPYFLSTIKELFQSFQDEEKKNERKKLGYQLVSIIISQTAIAFAATWFIVQVVNGNLLIGTLTFILASIADLRQSLSGLFANLGRQYQDSLFVTDIFKLLDTKPAIKRPEKGIVLDQQKTPEIIFENVSFAYPNIKKLVLKNFSLKIPAGEKLAIVGVNGAGKTTFVKLLCRFYDPTEGRILVNGHDLRDIDLESWYYQLGVIFQDYSNYHFLVKEAIAIGRIGKKTSLEKVKEAAKASEADIFIEEWEKGYEQMLGKEFSGGVEPSIGQWQKLALAKTFYRDPRILILDEPTSSIDAEAEAKIFEKLEALPKDRTVILISHRFSTVRKAEKIAVIENGEIKEFGSHEALLKLDGTYAHLFNIQAKGYK
ncbi:MAG TPA: ABC transporter ATP-binding protein [Candidatus Paceibacterota bacterium]|nr:ABC transporter ATP-binding protein [Candidatus Paceibacterota bacterium]